MCDSKTKQRAASGPAGKLRVLWDSVFINCWAPEGSGQALGACSDSPLWLGPVSLVMWEQEEIWWDRLNLQLNQAAHKTSMQTNLEYKKTYENDRNDCYQILSNIVYRK